jgi:L-methionine (R)-S-oxide reductase
MTPKQQSLLSDFERFAKAATSNSLMEHVAERLHAEVAYYNWVGFYLVDPADRNFLIVGPFVGSFTPNARIPLARGLCGAAALTGKTVAVNDVSKDTRYLSGSSMVKSEIVVPIFQKKTFIAELDVESYFADTFTGTEQEFVEACAAIVEAHASSR